LRSYDYSQSGAYFITICTNNRECLFGKIVDGVVQLSEMGKIIADSWQWLEEQYDYVELDEWVVMPNHMHGIIVINDDTCESCRGGSRTALTKLRRKPIGGLIGAYKTVSTKRINEFPQTPGAKLWQRNYWEHVIRNEHDLAEVREYIRNNSIKWEFDSLYIPT
jgi:putative transposase